MRIRELVKMSTLARLFKAFISSSNPKYCNHLTLSNETNIVIGKATDKDRGLDGGGGGGGGGGGHIVGPLIKSDGSTTNSCPNKTNEASRPARRALITGINGQVGFYLAELLLSKGYIVHGTVRRESSLRKGITRHAHLDTFGPDRGAKNLHLHYGDLTDAGSLVALINSIRPHEVYNLAAQSHVKISFEVPEMTGQTNALGTLRLLEAVRQFESSARDCAGCDGCSMVENGNSHRIKFYQASTSELFGGAPEQAPQNETTPFHPRSPYACAKLYAHSLVVNYRESYGLFAANGILFNHESPRRGESFVTRKISRSVAEIKLGRREHFEVGNLNSRRDWGHARDYVRAIWLILQQDEPRDFVIASGESHSVREFIERAFELIGVQIKWSGSGLDEVGLDCSNSKVRVRVSTEHFRPAEVYHLEGDATLAREQLKWRPEISFDELVKEMVEADIRMLIGDADTP